MAGDVIGVVMLILLLTLAVNFYLTRERSLVILSMALAGFGVLAGVLLFAGVFPRIFENLC